MNIIKEIEQNIIRNTLEQCGFEKHRDYISLSSMGMSIDEIWSLYKNGFTANEKSMMKCYKGYQMEEDLVRRVIESNPDIEFNTSSLVILEEHDGVIFMGHPDIVGDGIPFDCKSLLKDDWLPSTWKQVSRKIKFQIQSYMLAMNSERGVLIYESRESGLIRVIEARRNNEIVDEIKLKIEELKKRIKNG